jgi:hypothetical protein
MKHIPKYAQGILGCFKTLCRGTCSRQETYCIAVVDWTGQDITVSATRKVKCLRCGAEFNEFSEKGKIKY